MDKLIQKPLVSIGVPARNGGAYLEGAIESLVNQTYENIEIIISDNNSDDNTFSIIQKFAKQDKRIIYYQQSNTLTALENFKFVFEKSSGDYFMWAACDDRRSLDYVEKLLKCMLQNSDASIAFGSVMEITDSFENEQSISKSFNFETNHDDSLYIRLIRSVTINCYHVYGLIRTSVLKSYNWVDIDSGPDRVLLIHLSFLGDFIRAEGACFYYYVPLTPKSNEERALANGLANFKKFSAIRFSWACAKASKYAAKLRGGDVSFLRCLLSVYIAINWQVVKQKLFTISPSVVLDIYRKYKKL